MLESLAYFNLTSSNYVIDIGDQYCTYSIDSAIVSWGWSQLSYFLSSLTIIYIGLTQKNISFRDFKVDKIIKQFIFYLNFNSWNKEHLRWKKNLSRLFTSRKLIKTLVKELILGLFSLRELIKKRTV